MENQTNNLRGRHVSVHVQTLSNNLRELGVIESKRNTIRRGLVHELLNAQDRVLCSYFAQRSGARGEGRGRESTVEKLFKGWTTLNEIWRGSVSLKWAGRLREERTLE
jgi:hypothetical protein